MIDWAHFTPIESLGGGALIGLSAALLFAVNGKIAGISGIYGKTLRLKRDGLVWRMVFLLGLLLAPWAMQQTHPLLTHGVPLNRLAYLFFAGALTGFGTYLARGCTSGHGVCGLSRLSLRSLVAVVCFMTAGVVTVTLLRHVVGVGS